MVIHGLFRKILPGVKAVFRVKLLAPYGEGRWRAKGRGASLHRRGATADPGLTFPLRERLSQPLRHNDRGTHPDFAPLALTLLRNEMPRSIPRRVRAPVISLAAAVMPCRQPVHVSLRSSKIDLAFLAVAIAAMQSYFDSLNRWRAPCS